MIYYSKKDWWLVGPILGAISSPLALGVLFLLSHSPNRSAGYPLLVAGLMIGAIVLFLTYPLSYEITRSELFVRGGRVMLRHIPIATIDEVQPDRTIAGSPAWSLDRLRIDYRKNGEQVSLWVSPKSKVAFMQEIAGLDSDPKMKGDRLIRESVTK